MRTDSTAPQILDDMSRALTGLRSEMLGAETLALDDMVDLPEPNRASARRLYAAGSNGVRSMAFEKALKSLDSTAPKGV